MRKARLFCDDCNKWQTVNYDYVYELFNMKCPKCRSRNVWFGDIESENIHQEIKLGKGGCLHS